MPLDPTTAAAVAARHGLTLNDAAALAQLADDEAAADRLAATFAHPTDPKRQLLADLSGTVRPTDTTTTETARQNHVAREGNNAGKPDHHDGPTRRFLAHLAGRDPNLNDAPSTGPETY